MPWIVSLEISSFWRILTSNSFNVFFFLFLKSYFLPVSFEELKYRPPDLFPVISFLLSFSLHYEATLIELQFHGVPKENRVDFVIILVVVH